MKSIYTYYKERLIEISGKNRSLYMRSFSKKTAFDLGQLFECDTTLAAEFTDFLWKGKSEFTILSKGMRESLAKALGINEKTVPPSALPANKEERAKVLAKAKRATTEQYNKALESCTHDLSILKREIEDIEKETGRYELFVGYPYIYGGNKDSVFKAPLLMFPVEIDIPDDTTAIIRIKKGEDVELNKAFLLAYSQNKKLDLDGLVTEYSGMAASGYHNIASFLAHLKKFGIHISYSETKGLRNFKGYHEPDYRQTPTIKNVCMLARYSLANSIYNDYTELEKGRITNNAAAVLLNAKDYKYTKQKTAANGNCYYISNLDYAQRSVVEKVASSGNAVIYGPPGTGKSQTIVNLISDAVCKGKKVLVVSQKKAALDVVYNRLGALNAKAMFVVEPIKQRRDFYSKSEIRHNEVMASFKTASYDMYNEVATRLDAEVAKLQELSDAFSHKSNFGLSLLDMYYNSFIPGKKSGEYSAYKAMLNDSALMELNYNRLSAAVETLTEGDKLDTYYDYLTTRLKNPFVDHVKTNVSISVLSQTKTRLQKLHETRPGGSVMSGVPFARSVIAHYSAMSDPHNEKLYIKTLAAFSHPKEAQMLRQSKLIFPMYPYAKYKMVKAEAVTREQYQKSKLMIQDFLRDYEFLRDILTDEGFAIACDGLLSGRTDVMVNLFDVLSNYVKLTDVQLSIARFTRDEETVLRFASRSTNSFADFKNIVHKILPIRIYREVIDFEDKMKESLSKTADFDNIKMRIKSLLAEQQELCKNIFMYSFDSEYRKMYERGIDNKDYLYQITKKQNYWPIRKTMEHYGEYLLTLFPCWLMSPENVSTLLPLEKDMFDLVLFDEASQVLIESTIPSIVRGKNIVVAGDAKQLRPTTTFMRRYMGGADDDELDLATQAALEVESLLDLAVARYDSANITYHYRSVNRELIDFSNKAFYDNKLKIAPNYQRTVGKDKPISRILVDGKWEDRRNDAEAKEIVGLLKRIFRTRKNDETIGIITFNAEQQAHIENVISDECKNDVSFRSKVTREQSRKIDGEDVSLFIKNIENVQGDERDIIIFSIGYARNNNGKVNAHFGPLSVAGGENRLNVAVTRAKRKIYVITSIEPEELKIEGTKNSGPKLFKQYLAYARAVSSGKQEDINSVLDSLGETETESTKALVTPIEAQIAAKLKKLGYAVETDFGTGKNELSLAIFDKEKGEYVLGIQLDQTAFRQSPSVLERDIFSSAFLEQKGWKILRVWSRDWWHNADGVIRNIVAHLG